MFLAAAAVAAVVGTSRSLLGPAGLPAVGLCFLLSFLPSHACPRSFSSELLSIPFPADAAAVPARFVASVGQQPFACELRGTLSHIVCKPRILQQDGGT